MPIEITNTRGQVVWTIDARGRLFHKGKRVTDPAKVDLIDSGSATALDGSRVTDFRRADLLLKRFTKGRRTWWAAEGHLCNIRDIDHTRRAIAAQIRGAKPITPADFNGPYLLPRRLRGPQRK